VFDFDEPARIPTKSTSCSEVNRPLNRSEATADIYYFSEVLSLVKFEIDFLINSLLNVYSGKVENRVKSTFDLSAWWSLFCILEGAFQDVVFLGPEHVGQP